MKFWNFVNSAQTGASELYIDGEIASEESWWSDVVTPRAFRRELARVGDVTVFINSPGGDVFAGAEIYTALREHKGKVTVKISGIAASAASVIAMAGDEVLMSPVAYMMIHDPWTYAVGNARDLEHTADVLRTVAEGMISAYITKTGKTRDEIAALLEGETYMNAQEAVDLGFADGILYEDTQSQQPETGSRARIRMQAKRYGPDAVCAMLRAGEPPKVPDKEGPNADKRHEIAQWAQIIASLY